MEEYKSELQLQSLIYRWFHKSFPQYRIPSKNKKLIRCLLIHNFGNPRSLQQGSVLKGCGLTAGIPDLTLLVPKNGYSGLFMELKIGNEKPRPEQVEMMKALENQGYKCTWCNNLETAREIILDYLK